MILLCPNPMTKVLVIDDDDVFRQSLVATLERQGYEVLQADTGAKGVQLARDQSPELILCDMNMAGVSGQLTLYALRKDARIGSIPFVLMSGFPLNEFAFQGVERGADGFLSKPFTPAQLVAAIERQLNTRERLRGQAQNKLAELQSDAGAGSSEESLEAMKRIVETTGFIITKHRELQLQEIIRLTTIVHESALRLQQHIEELLRVSKPPAS